MRTRIAVVALALIVALARERPAVATTAGPPFVVAASNGPAAGSHIIATVTRTIGKSSVTLPAALVPALKPGDVVDVDFPGYRRPPGSVNYHVNVAFITEAAPRHWLIERSGPADRLFAVPRKRGERPARTGTIHFVYGSGTHTGIPIFFIIPEDAKTRGVDGVRDYVDAHPTDFVDMSQSTNDAVDHYSFLRDFLSSLGSGAIDPKNAQVRIQTLTQSFGVSPASIAACYAGGGSSPDIANCIQQAVNGVVYQTNFSAPTQAQFLGGLAGATSPLSVAPYIASLLTVWRLFVSSGHQEYEYLPTTISLADPRSTRTDELLMGLKIPTIRPPAAYSDVLFFTIGDPQATDVAPSVINDAPANGICERDVRFSLPLHFDRTSRYVHDAFLEIAPNGAPAYTIPLDPHALSGPIVDRSRFTGSRDGAYTIALRGSYGFDPVAQPAQAAMRAAFPTAASWAIAPALDQVPRAGGDLDIIATSPSAACLSHAALHVGDAALPLTSTRLDAQRVELRASLAGVPAGNAQIRLYEDDGRSGRTYASTAMLAIRPAPARVDAASGNVALEDRAVRLTGNGFDQIGGLAIGGVNYANVSVNDATTACFTGPALTGRGLAIGQKLTAQLQPRDGTPGQAFVLTIAPPRPAVTLGASPPANGTVHLTTQPDSFDLQSARGTLPQQFSIRARQAGATPASPCAVLQPDPNAVSVPATAVHLRAGDVVHVDLRADLLGDRGFGTLQVQLVDTQSGLGSDWLTLPGTFARAPDVAGIDCAPGLGTDCRIYGSNLAAIDAVQAADGSFVAPGRDCPPSDKGAACVTVPRLPHYLLRLVDGATLESLPDALIGIAPR